MKEKDDNKLIIYKIKFPGTCYFYSMFPLFITLLILFFLPSSFSINEVNNTEDSYSIKNTFQYVDEFGYLHLLGEIFNESQNPLTNITLTANFYDIDGNLIGDYYRHPEISTLNPFEVSPFQIIYLDPGTSKNVKNYTIAAKFHIGKIKPGELIIEAVNSRFDINGFYYINGQIKNNGENSANNVTVVATVYDKSGRVIGVTKAITEPFIIPSKTPAAFGAAITSKTQALKIKDFALKAYSDKYLSHTISTKKIDE